MSCTPTLFKSLNRAAPKGACSCIYISSRSLSASKPSRWCCKPPLCQLSTLGSCNSSLSADILCMDPACEVNSGPSLVKTPDAHSTVNMSGIKQKMVSMCKRSAHIAASSLSDSLVAAPCGGGRNGFKDTEAAVPKQSDKAEVVPVGTAPPTKSASPKLTFYRRELPKDLVSFTSAAGRKLFKESLNEGYAEGYFNLAGNFTVQSEPAYCGPSSLAMVLNALEVDPGRTWKGVWRWYSDELLESCRTESDLKANGITFDQFLCLASSHARVVVKRGKTATREEFLRDIKYVTQRDDIFMVLSFSRAVMGQTGDGHFSPIGAYHPQSNKALVLDSARYKYPSWFADVDKLYDSLQPVDPETNLPRGYFMISRLDSQLDLSPLEPKLPQANALQTENVVDLPERPADVFPTKLTCGKKPSCCLPK
ncbi:hypothetical protein IWW36_002073 [Coemansia brasiliensis]|uniref:glutathione gamma-glutamylcysteinyltransferase n=1 Tax=Coemansia brasiliensis TaxID=2650707 RepID=A0A9W8IFK7_9FUNG|nr:hypothetical protein IWW36_002073 [Coemansia brasiliensis]